MNNKNNLNVVHKSEGAITTEEDHALYQILKKLPSPDVKFKLSAAQKKWWYYFGLEFISTSQIAKLDLIHLQKAAFWMDARCQAIKQIQLRGYTGGLVQIFASGANNVSAHVTIIEKADKHLDEVSAHFGLSIKDRQKLAGATSEDPDQLNFLKALNLLNPPIAK